VLPESREIAETIAESSGETIAPHDAEAACMLLWKKNYTKNYVISWLLVDIG
jgi:hypothetical protein